MTENTLKEIPVTTADGTSAGLVRVTSENPDPIIRLASNQALCEAMPVIGDDDVLLIPTAMGVKLQVTGRQLQAKALKAFEKTCGKVFAAQAEHHLNRK